MMMKFYKVRVVLVALLFLGASSAYSQVKIDKAKVSRNKADEYKNKVIQILGQRYGSNVFNNLLVKECEVVPIELVGIEKNKYEERSWETLGLFSLDGFIYKFLNKFLDVPIVWVAIDLDGNLHGSIQGPKDRKTLNDVVNNLKSRKWTLDLLKNRCMKDDCVVEDLKLNWHFNEKYKNEYYYYYTAVLIYNRTGKPFEYITINPLDGRITRGKLRYVSEMEIRTEEDNDND